MFLSLVSEAISEHIKDLYDTTVNRNQKKDAALRSPILITVHFVLNACHNKSQQPER